MMISEHGQDCIFPAPCFCLHSPGMKWRLHGSRGRFWDPCPVQERSQESPNCRELARALAVTDTVARRQMSKGRWQLKEQGMHCISIMHRPLRNSQGHGQHLPAPPMAFVADIALTHLEGSPMQERAYRSLPALPWLSSRNTLCLCLASPSISNGSSAHPASKSAGPVCDLSLSRSRVPLPLQVTLCLVLSPTCQQVTG